MCHLLFPDLRTRPSRCPATTAGFTSNVRAGGVGEQPPARSRHIRLGLARRRVDRPTNRTKCGSRQGRSRPSSPLHHELMINRGVLQSCQRASIPVSLGQRHRGAPADRTTRYHGGPGVRLRCFEDLHQRVCKSIGPSKIFVGGDCQTSGSVL
ncbi:DUF6207 family protein [Streptomyces sp. FR-108]|uniref:DUF6207 family protein n=1 Tax=Streptomyces sp. FR-108 TaxID=3416665 RepID=UPI003CED8F0F